MPRYKIHIEYDGTNYHGMQTQENLPTIAAKIEEAIEKFTGEKIQLFASGRTDARVHAFNQVAHFDMLQEREIYNIISGINFHLKGEKIAIHSCEKVAQDFHARYSAKTKFYKYLILNELIFIFLKID